MKHAEEKQQENAAELERAIDEATEAVAIQARELEQLQPGGATGEPLGLGHLLDVPVRVTVEVGRTRLTLAELVRLGPGSLVTLDRESHEPADILVNGKIVAKGEIVTLDGSYGVRISEVRSQAPSSTIPRSSGLAT
jgi:flagellar motor switch protein FliN/FliY